jgi:hypothetical protein
VNLTGDNRPVTPVALIAHTRYVQDKRFRLASTEPKAVIDRRHRTCRVTSGLLGNRSLVRLRHLRRPDNGHSAAAFEMRPSAMLDETGHDS